MARLPFGPPPVLADGAHYREYRGWLLRELFEHTCAYCLLTNDSVQIDHYEPVKYAEAREHDPRNLVFGCPTCNGRGGKSDYHPKHAARTRLPRDTTGYLVIDVRAEDFAKLFRIDANGRIAAREGVEADRALWNVVLLKLDRANHARGDLLGFLGLCEDAIDRSRTEPELAPKLELILEKLVPFLARRLLLFRAFDVPMSPTLAARLEESRAAAMGSSARPA